AINLSQAFRQQRVFLFHIIARGDAAGIARVGIIEPRLGPFRPVFLLVVGGIYFAPVFGHVFIAGMGLVVNLQAPLGGHRRSEGFFELGPPGAVLTPRLRGGDDVGGGVGEFMNGDILTVIVVAFEIEQVFFAATAVGLAAEPARPAV